MEIRGRTVVGFLLVLELADHCNDTLADNDAERDGIDDQSSVEVVQVVVVPQLGGRKGRRRWNNATQD